MDAANTASVPATSSWAETILLGKGTSAELWQAIFDKVSSLVTDGAAEGTGARSMIESLDRADDLLAEAAWDLWQTYANDAPSAADALSRWWTGTATRFGKAILILDAFSVREMQHLLMLATKRGVTPTRAYVRGSACPSDTQAFAAALGLTGRAQLRASGAGPSFRWAMSNLVTDVPTDSFDALSASIPTERNLVLWHPWLDDLLHSKQQTPNAATTISSIAHDTLAGDGFWKLIEVLRTGRDLVITADHGYAVSRGFAELPQDVGRQMAEGFGAKRCAKAPGRPVALVAGQPLYVVAQEGGRAAVVGRRKWSVAGGYPHVTHGGLTLPEVCIPVIHLAAL